jgi:hypothetical protein
MFNVALASLVEASPGNIKKTMMGATRLRQHVFRYLGNQTRDSSPKPAAASTPNPTMQKNA